jgi:20S proteasome subunit alpha 2
MATGGDRYSFSLTTFSPSGKLVQIEYALNAVLQGYTSIGIRTKNGVVLATEKKAPSSLVDPVSLGKISLIAPGLGMVYSGMGPDARVLVDKARKSAQAYWQIYREWPTAQQLVREVAAIMQEFTQSGGVRPFGVSLLITGFDYDDATQTVCRPALYQVDPSGSYWAWKASAIGKNMVSAKTFLEKRYQDDMSLEDAVHLAILSLKESFEGNLVPEALDIAVLSFVPSSKSSQHTQFFPEFHGVDPLPSFHILTDSEVGDYLATI